MTTLAQVFAEADQKAHPDMKVLGPAAWAELHAWADRFAAKVGDSCSCGLFAQDAARALHDVVNMKLGKKAMYPETLQEMANVFYGTAKSMRSHPLLMQEAANMVQAEGTVQVLAEAPAVPIWCRVLPESQSLLRRAYNTLMPLPAYGGGGTSELAAYRRALWEAERLGFVAADACGIEAGQLAAHHTERREEQAEMGATSMERSKWPRPGKTFSSEAEARAWAKEIQKPGYVLPGLSPWQVDIWKWPAEWEPVEGEETWVVDYWSKGGVRQEHGIYPWPEGMFDEEDEEEEDEGMERKKEPAHLSQSFIDTILHTAIGTGVAIGVAKVLNPPAPSIIKEEEKPQEPPSPTPAVLSPAHVEGDQANVDLGTLLEEIDAILKKPEMMGIVDADTLTIVRG